MLPIKVHNNQQLYVYGYKSYVVILDLKFFVNNKLDPQIFLLLMHPPPPTPLNLFEFFNHLTGLRPYLLQ